MSSDLKKIETKPLAEVQPVPTSEVGSLIRLSIENNQDPTALYALLEKERETQAKQAYMVALVAFHADCPPVPRKTQDDYLKVTRNGVKVPRMYSSIDDVQNHIKPYMLKHGLVCTFGDAVHDEKTGLLRQTCKINHVGGHTEPMKIDIPVESNSGTGPQQKYGISITYAKRYGMIAALGLSGCDDDPDGYVDKKAEPVETINDQQYANLEDLVNMCADPEGSKRRCIARYKIEKLSDLPLKDYDCVEGKFDAGAKANKGKR